MLPRLRFFLLLLLIACSPGLRPPSGIAGAPAGTAAIERFLEYAASRDYSGMGWIFGTSDGPVLARDPLPEVEQRMYLLANLLENDGFVIGGGSPVPGRSGDALRFQVTLRQRDRSVQVPFTTVRGPRDRWYVEQLDVEAITGGE